MAVIARRGPLARRVAPAGRVARASRPTPPAGLSGRPRSGGRLLRQGRVPRRSRCESIAPFSLLALTQNPPRHGRCGDRVRTLGRPRRQGNTCRARVGPVAGWQQPWVKSPQSDDETMTSPATPHSVTLTQPRALAWFGEAQGPIRSLRGGVKCAGRSVTRGSTAQVVTRVPGRERPGTCRLRRLGEGPGS
jgi:hypothetical protein